MAENILESYFVKVGALPDVASFTILGKQLVKTGKSVLDFSENSVKEILKLDLIAQTSFAAMGMGLINLADRTAMTDQSYRLFGLRMLMTKESARAMQLALDELGATIDEVAYDQELNKRFRFLYDQNIRLGRELGENFDDVTEKMRTVRTEYKRFGTEIEMTVWGTVTKLFDRLGYGQDSFLRKLNDINEWFSEKMPDITDEISQRLVPAWEDAVVVVKNLGEDLKGAATEFTLLTGVLTGDESLQDTQFSIEHLTTAIQDWTDAMAKSILAFSAWVRYVTHGFNAVIEGGKGLIQSGPIMDPEGAKKSYALSEKEFANVYGDFLSIFDPDLKRELPDFKNLVELHDEIERRKQVRETRGAMAPIIAGDFKSSALADLSQFSNVPPELLASIIKAESGGNIFATSDKSTAAGLGQLIESNRKRFGVTNPFDPIQNVYGTTALLSELQGQTGGNIIKTILAYHDGISGLQSWARIDKVAKDLIQQGKHPGTDAALDKALGEKYGFFFKTDKGKKDPFIDFEKQLQEMYGEETEGMPFPDIPASREAQREALRVMKDMQYRRQKAASEGGGGDTIINGLNIYVPSALPRGEWEPFVKGVLNDEREKKTKTTQAQVAGGPY